MLNNKSELMSQAAYQSNEAESHTSELILNDAKLNLDGNTSPKRSLITKKSSINGQK